MKQRHLAQRIFIRLLIIGIVLGSVGLAWTQSPRKPAPPASRTRTSPQKSKKPAPHAEKPMPPLLKPDLVIQSGHANNIRAIVYSPDGKLVASASSDKTIRLWEAETGHLLRVMDYHRDSVTSIAFSPDGKTMASGSLDKTVAICDVKTGRLIHSLIDHTDEVVCVAFSPDGKTIASGSRDKTIDLWEASTGEVIMTIEDPACEARALAFSPDGKMLASGSTDKTLRLWQVGDGQMIRAMEGHSAAIRTIAFSPDGQTIASGGDDQAIKIWNVESGLLLRTLNGHSSIVTSIAFNPSGQLLFSGSHDKTIRVWDVQSGKTVNTITGASETITSMALSPDGNTVAAGSWTAIDLWKSGTGKWIRTLEGRLSSVRSVAFSPNGKTLAYATRNSIKLWDSGSGALIATLDGHTSQVNGVAFSPDGKLLASASADKAIKLWDVASNKPLRDLTGHISNVTALAFSSDSKFIASGSVDKSVKLWDVQSGKLRRTFEGHFTLISAVTFAPDGKTIASGSYDNSVKLWDVESGKAIYTLTGHASEVTGLAFSPDGTLLATCSRDKTIKLWDPQTGQLVRTLEGHALDIFTVAFSPDGKMLASGSYDKTLRLWEVQSGKLMRTLEGHSGAILAVAFSPDGRYIASGSDDATANIWSPDMEQPLCTLASFNDGGEWLVITPDGLFDGSPEAWQAILWRFAGNTFDVAPVEVFFNEFYYPGLLADVLAGKRPKAAQNIARLDRRQPQVSLAVVDDGPSANRAIPSRKVKIRVRVAEALPDADHPSGSGARDVRLFRNGALVKAWRGDVLSSPQHDVTLEESISIVAGENRLTAYAFNNANIKSGDASLALMGGEGLKRKGTAYILVVGINEYANSQYDLRFATADGQTFGDTLRQSLGKQRAFAQVEVIPLINQDATRSNILAALGRLAGNDNAALPNPPEVLKRLKPAEPEDAVIIYFAGHGTAQQARFYLIPQDLGYTGERDELDETGLATLLAHSISDLELEQAFEKIDAGQLVLVLDACNSGQALESQEKRRGPMNSKGLAQLAYEKGIYILTAAQAYQAALEADELGHGFLTYALVEEGLKMNAADTAPNDRQITLREWLDYAVGRVPQMQAAALAGSRGLKVVFVEGEENITDPAKRNLQRPRIFYRREADPQPFIVERVAGKDK